MAQPDLPSSRLILRAFTACGLLALFAGYIAIWVYGGLVAEGLLTLAPFTLLGVAGAMIANSTGVGGGAVFVPAFSALREAGILNLNHTEVVGLSFAIQCFGMSVGSLTWLNRLAAERRETGQPGVVDPQLARLIVLGVAFAIPSLLLVQRLFPAEPATGFLAFKLFSIVLGLALLAQLVFRPAITGSRDRLQMVDILAVAVLSLLGGAATAWFSVGLGELLALYLFLRGFRVTLVVPAAVICSAIAVLSGVVHPLSQGSVAFEVLVFAAPGVALGGFLARRLAYWMGARPLKLFTALWITGSSAGLLLL